MWEAGGLRRRGCVCEGMGCGGRSGGGPRAGSPLPRTRSFTGGGFGSTKTARSGLRGPFWSARQGGPGSSHEGPGGAQKPAGPPLQDRGSYERRQGRPVAVQDHERRPDCEQRRDLFPASLKWAQALPYSMAV